MTNARGKPRRLAVMAEPPPEPWRPNRAAADPCPERYFDLGDELGRGVERRWNLNGRLEDFVVQLEAEEDGSYRVVCQVDCCDDEVHLHRYDQSGAETRRQHLMPITTQDDLTAGLKLARKVVLDRAVENLGIWRRGH